MKRFFALILCVFFLIACTTSSSPEAEVIETEEPASEQAEGEKTAKDNFPFSTTDIDGNPFDQDCFADYDLVMLNFWAYWCGPCIMELPELEELHQAYPNLLLLGVSVDNSDMESVRSAVEESGITYPVLYPKGGLAYLSDKCQYIPTTYFLSKDGRILGEPVVGSNNLQKWSALVDSYLP
jgi:thiol-disulfide isomerase/thioredoxin